MPNRSAEPEIATENSRRQFLKGATVGARRLRLARGLRSRRSPTDSRARAAAAGRAAAQ